MHAFWVRGYAACSLSDLLAATGLSKSSLYNHFGGKRELFKQCLSGYRRQSVERMSQRLGSALSAGEFLATILNSVACDPNSGVSPRGCFVMNTATEFGQTDNEIAQLVEQSLAHFRQVFLEAILRGQASGEFSGDRSAEDMATYMLSSMAGLRTMVKGGIDEASVRRTVDLILTALK